MTDAEILAAWDLNDLRIKHRVEKAELLSLLNDAIDALEIGAPKTALRRMMAIKDRLR